jgi:hypothetical protein
MKLNIFSTDGSFYGTIEPSSDDLSVAWWNKNIFGTLQFSYTSGEKQGETFKLMVVPQDSAQVVASDISES